MLLPVLAALVSLLAPASPASAAPAAPAVHAASAPGDAPLALTIDRLSPSSIPRDGKVMVSGWVTNNSDETWVDIAIYTFIASEPITTSDDLAFESTRDAEEPVGDRITVPGTYETIAELAPGASLPYTNRVDVSYLSVEAAGTYWFGVHALGTSTDGRDTVADGRARTFLPYVPPEARQEPVDTALVLPVRRQVLHEPDGRVSDEDEWIDSLDDGGRLSSIIDFGLAAGGRAVTWLLDPAVPDAARRLADGNPSRELVEVPEGDPVGEGEPGSSEGDPTPDEGSPTAEPSPDDTVESRIATRWVAKLNQAVTGKQVLALPWGDVDVAAAAKRSTDTYADARARSGNVLSTNQAPMTPAIAAPSGFLDDAALALADADTTVLISDRAVARGVAPTVATYDGRKVVFFSSEVLRGGPGPDDPLAPVAVRQRILSEAAVRMTQPARQPLVVVFPPSWDPPGSGDYSEFFEGLAVNWMNLSSLADATAVPARTLAADRFTYPNWQVNHEVDDAAFAALDDLGEEALRLQGVISVENDLAARIRSEALGNVSYFAREAAVRSRLATVNTTGWVRARLGSISVSGPNRVILSSESGPFSVTVTNGLDQPVTVRLTTTSSPPMNIEVPEQLELDAESTTTRLLEASTDKLGVHNVTVEVTDLDGNPLGSSARVPVRAAQVSDVIWLVMGGALALLFVAIVLRLVRRIRGGGQGPDSGDDDDQPPSDSPLTATREPASAG